MQSLTDHPTLKAVERLLPSIAARAVEMEDARMVPADICLALEEAGCLTMAIPSHLGGGALDLLDMSRVLEMLARADASVAWTAMVALGFNFVFSRFSPAVVEQVHSVSPGFLTRGAVAPMGRATPVEGGYMVAGRWALGSGSYDHRFVMAMCMVMDGDKPAIGADGAPVMRVALLPATSAEFLDTWKSVGLCATNSHDFQVKSVFVPADWTAAYADPDHFDLPLTRFNFYMASTPNHASVALGVAQGMLDDIIALSLTKRPTRGGGKTLSADPLFANDLGRLAVRLESLRALLHARLAENSALARGDAPIDPLESAKTCAVASYVQHECQDIVNLAFTLGGSTVCYLSSSLQRRWRDMRCVVQHIAASKAKFMDLGNAMVNAAAEAQA